MIPRSDIENIRKAVKQEGDYKPTAEEIREAILKICPDESNIIQHKMEIVQEVIKMQSAKNETVSINTEEGIGDTPETEIQTTSNYDQLEEIQPTEEPQVEELTNNSTSATEKADHLALLDESQKTTTITTTPHGEIVQKAFSQLGFKATEKEIFEIIKAFESTQKVGDEFFDQVLPLVKEWIRKKTEKQVHKYEQAYEEIAGDVCESLQEIAEAKDKCDTNLFIFRQTFGSERENFQDDTRKSVTNIEEFLANW
jgi:hypothetical protein